MAFFKSLAKEHGQKFFEPVGKALQREKIRSFNPANPAHAFALRNELIPYAMWRAGKMLESPDHHVIPNMNPALQAHVDFAMEMLNENPIELSQNMVKHQLKLADRQCRIADLSRRVQDTIIMLVTALWAHQQQDEVQIAAADILCQDLRRALTGERASDKYYRSCAKLADMIIEGKYKDLADIYQSEILFGYSKNPAAKEPATAGKS
jgi:hypothetical protein